MNFKHAMIPIAVTSALSLGIVANAQADGAKALSFIEALDFRPFPDNDRVGEPGYGEPDCTIGQPGCAARRGTQDVPQSASSARKMGVPDAGSTTVDPAAPGRGPLNVDQACVATPPNAPQEQPPEAQVSPPCPPPDTYSQVEGFPDNNFARADAQIQAVQGFAFPGFEDQCPPVSTPGAGTGVCGTQDKVAPEARSIAEVQLNKELEDGASESDTVDSANLVFAGETAVTFRFRLDWCREARLRNAVRPSIARALTNANITITKQENGNTVTVFDASASDPDTIALLRKLNSDTTLTPTNGPLTDRISEDVFGPLSPDQGCFPRRLEPVTGSPGIEVIINTNPTGLPKVECDAARPACFISGEPGQPESEYSFSVFEGTDVDGIVQEQIPPPPVFKWYFTKQAFLEDPNDRLSNPIARNVALNDQFAQRRMDVRLLEGLMNPAGKNQPRDPAIHDHLTCYQLVFTPPQIPPRLPREIDIQTENFGSDTIRISNVAQRLCGAAIKNDEGSIAGPFYTCYQASSPQRDFDPITLDDQFFTNKPHALEKLSYFCTPVGVNAAVPETNPEEFDHLACYDFRPQTNIPHRDVNLFDRWIQADKGHPVQATVEREERFCERARKIAVRQ